MQYSHVYIRADVFIFFFFQTRGRLPSLACTGIPEVGFPDRCPAPFRLPPNRLIGPHFPTDRMLGLEIRIPLRFEPGREILVETRLLEARADGRDGPRTLGDPDGRTSAIRGIGAEPLIVLQPRSAREAHRRFARRGG